MYQIRVHGRDGQGVVTAAELIAWAAIYDGHYALASRGFGSEGEGDPVEACCRIDEVSIREGELVDDLDALLVLDATLLGRPALFQGLRPYGLVLVNSRHEMHKLAARNVRTVPATELAVAHTGRRLPSAPMSGAFAAASGMVSIEAVRTALTVRFPGTLGEACIRAADEAYVLLQEDAAAEFEMAVVHASVPEADREIAKSLTAPGLNVP